MFKRRTLFVILIAALLTPLWMYLAWVFTPKRKLVFAIVDKTVLNQKGQEHVSLTWVLNNQRLTKTPTKKYLTNNDYFGFFPGPDKKFKIKGLERFSSEQLNKLSADVDATYFTDTYGVYKNEWYAQKNVNEHSDIIYGGMSEQDLEFLEDMKARHKLIIAEFNTIESPTTEDNRVKFEYLFGLHWSNWSARYFESLDSVKNKEIPKWLTRAYMEQHDKKWPFHKAGIAFVSNSGQVVVLGEGTYLSDPMPYILTAGYGQKVLSLPAKIKYPYWFDIIMPDLTVNHVISRFDISVNAKGKAELAQYGIPATFPAILMHNSSDYRFYYFSGDFCDNPVGMGSSYFKGVGAFKWLFYNSDDDSERGSFFWEFYRPMMTAILEQNAGKR
jgi:hypothetical protein